MTIRLKSQFLRNHGAVRLLFIILSGVPSHA